MTFKGRKGYGIIAACFCLLALAVSVFCLIKNAPRTYRNDGAYHGEIRLSRESGFYGEPFYLEIKAPTDEIYYTLDGTEPDRNSLKYESPILIYDKTEDDNIHSARTDCSIFQSEELGELYREYREDAGIINVMPDYVTPDYNVAKCTIIKAVYYNDEGERSIPVSGSYFVGKDFINEASTDTVSIITDPDNIFGYERGIYVLGEKSDEFWAEVESTTDEDERQEMLEETWGANYICSGAEWEREATLQFFSEGRADFTQQAGVRIQGGYSRELLPKSLKLYAREVYDGNSVIHTEQNRSLCMDKLVLYNGGEDVYTKIKDPLMSDICADMDFATTSYRPCIVYLDGEYWGYYFITERIDKRFFQIKYGVDDDNVILTKYGLLKEGVESDLEAYENDMLFISDADMTVQENYDKACEIIDVQSLIDYMAAEIYIARWYDWPSNNYALWKSRDPEKGRYGDCRWRFILFDVNWGGMTYEDGDATRDTIELTREASPLFDNMCNNPEFKEAFIKRLEEIREKDFNPDRVAEMIDGYVEMMEEPMNEHYERFFGTDSSMFYKSTDDLKKFFYERYDYVPEMIENNFG